MSLPFIDERGRSLSSIDALIDDTIYDKRDQLKREKVQKIHRELHTYRNSINLLVGKQGLGKSFTSYREIIKISCVDPTSHILLIINKDGKSNDATFNVLKELFRIPVEFISYDDAEDRIREILKYKDLYNRIKLEHLEDKIEDDQVFEICSVLQIPDLDQPFLNTIIYFDDCANNKLFKQPTQYFPQLIATCRHNGLTFFFASQFWKGMPTELKSNALTIYIFRDFSKQQLDYIFLQTPLKQDKKRVYEIYRTLREHDKLVVDVVSGKIIVDKS
jgi:hypothetical protein